MKKQTYIASLFSIIAVAACLTMVIIGVMIIHKNKDAVIGTTNEEIDREIEVGGSTSFKETTGHKIGIRYRPFYREDKFSIEVFMSQTLYGDINAMNGYPVLEIYQETDGGKCVKINGRTLKYTKKFKIEDLSYLGTDSILNDVFDGYSEKVSLDLSNIAVGQTIKIVFSYGFFYYNNNPYNDQQPDNSWAGYRRSLYCYCGENGISISSNCEEDAISNYEKKDEGIHESGHNPSDGVMCSAKDLYLQPLYDSFNSVTHGNCIVNSFKVHSAKSYRQYSVNIKTSDGISIVGDTDYITSDDIIVINYHLKKSEPYGTIVLEICGINDKEKNTFSKTIYCATENDMDYSCTNCLDCLMDYSPDINKLITDAENSNESSFISHSVTGSFYAIPTYCVQGYIRWTDSSGHIHPARNVSVEIRGANSSTSTSWLLTTVTTNDSGFYTANITSNSYGDDVFIRVKSKGLNITVKNPTGAEYQYNSGIHYGLTDGDIANISYTADNTYDLGKSMGVHQAMELANRYMFSLENAYMSNINVSYPDDSEGTTCYKKSENKIYVLSEDAFDWDVLEHEYGHYVQDYFNIENSPGGYHSSDENIADNSRNKSKGVYLAWGEGWATYFAINLQNKMNAVSFGIPNVGDDLYQDTVDATINYSIENLPVSKRLGESNEATVAAVLYDITDPVNTVEGDYIYCNDGNIWNIIKNNNCTNLSQFINCFYNSSFLMRVRLSLGSTLSNYKVAAYQTTSLTTGVPSFTWVKQGGSIYYPNNSFSLAFYNSSYELIARVDCGNTTTKTLTLTQWNTIKSGESTIYCCIETKQTSIPSTGAYYSNLIVISIP